MTLRHVLQGVSLSVVVGAAGCDISSEIAPVDRTTSPPTESFTTVMGVGGAPAPITRVEPPNVACAVAVPGTAGAGFVPGSMTGQVTRAEVPPPPISGGTLLATADGATLVAADPERDQLYFVSTADMQLSHTLSLREGDQPGRVVEDAAGRIHVVLRGGRGIASVGLEADSEITRRELCAQPRGIAYDSAQDQLHVACAEGKLVSVGAAPELPMMRSVDVGADVRDVLVKGDQVYVSRFRAAELLVLNQGGTLMETHTPATFGHDEDRVVQEPGDPSGNSCGSFIRTERVHVESTPNVAWRMIDVPGAGVAMLHQRARTDEIQTTAGGYGSGSCGPGIVQTSITVGLDTANTRSTDVVEATLAVDIASDSEGKLLAMVAPGNHGVSQQVQLLTLLQLPVSTSNGAAAGVPVDMDPAFKRGESACAGGTFLPEPVGQATAVAFANPYVVVVQEREPAALSFYDVRTQELRGRVQLDTTSTQDTGHALFHMRAGAGVACASCHPDAGDDGHVWSFATIGPRRTQTLRGGVLGTEPLHWNGDMRDFTMLMQEVFVGRMAGFSPTTDQTDALSQWIDKQPALHVDGADASAVERGKALFEAEEVGCADCHMGPHLTNNETEDVGTGAPLQVPSLKGLKFRTPLMHDGCAATIAERFTDPTCGGGDDHGQVSQLSAAEVSDLVAYLETL